MFISDTSIKQPVLVTMVMLAIVVFGLVGYNFMPVNLLPDIEVPIVSVTIPYPGAGPEAVADQVAQPVEDALVTINGVTSVTATAAEGGAVFLIEFVQGRDPDFALQDVRESVTGIRAALPDAIGEPVYQQFDPAQTPIVTMAVTSSAGMSGQELRRLVADEIVPRIQRASGVGSATINGGRTRQINVQLDLQRLTSFRVLPSEVSTAISQAAVDIGMGSTRLADQEVTLRAPSPFESPQDIARVGIPRTGFQVADVAEVEDGLAEVETYSRLNRRDAITLDIRKQSGTNTVAVADAALEAAAAAFEDFPQLNYTVVRNDAEQVRRNVRGALLEIAAAVVFASLVVFAFFRDLRNTLVTVIGLPIIIIGTFAAMSLFGLTINILTLLSLSISVGLIIDDAIVVRENIFRHLEMGEQPREAASRGTAEVALPVVAMTLTLVAVFVPVAFTPGTAGIIFQSFGITVAAATVISLFEAFTLAPMISAYWFKKQEPAAEEPAAEEPPTAAAEQAAAEPAAADEQTGLSEAEEQNGFLERLYEPVLIWALARRGVVVLIAVAVLAASVWLATTLDFAFLPASEEAQLGVAFELPAGTPLENTNERARAAEQILLADPAVRDVLTTVGGASQTQGLTLGAGGGSERANFLLVLDPQASIEATVNRLDKNLAEFPSLVIAPPQYQTGTSTDIATRPIQVEVRTTGSQAELAPLIDEMVAAIADVPGLRYVDTTYSGGNPELQVEILLDRAREYGLTNADMASTIRALLSGDEAATFRSGGDEYPIVVRLRPQDRQQVEDLRTLRIPLGGNLVPVTTVADISLSTGPSVVRRVNQEVEVVIGGINIGRNINEVQSDIQERLDAIELPPDVQISYGGATEEQAESFQNLLLAMGLSIIFVYMVLASQFGSFLQPLIIMLAMPLSAIGAFLALKITGTTLTILAMIGFIMLLGLVTKNSILLVDFTNMARERGANVHDAIVQGGRLRLRPILMTSLSVILGSLPAAIAFGEGGGLRRGLAIVVVGGMISATLLTLVIIPVAYSLLAGAVERVKAWRSRRRERKQQRRATATSSD